MGQGSCKASPTKDRITDDFCQRDLKANVPLEASVSERVPTRCVRLYHFLCGFNASIRRIRPLHRVVAHVAG